MVVISYLGVAQLVARYLGVVEAAGSSPVTQTISSAHNGFQLWALDFFILKQLFSFLLCIGAGSPALFSLCSKAVML